tara:strand:- start:794 stop:2065 length:1272 start_codon:yes stop_codon:yes gene_type:complete
MAKKKKKVVVAPKNPTTKQPTWAIQQTLDVPQWVHETKEAKKRWSSIITGIPHLSKSKVTIDWAIAYKAIHGMLGCTGGEVIVRDLPIAEARNEIIRQALANDADYIFFLGDDVIAPHDVLHRLWCHNKDMVCGVYWSRNFPSTPYIWKDKGKKGPYMDWKYGEMFKIDYSGVDCILINTDVFKKMKEPWFSTDWSTNIEVAPVGYTTEDFYFYEKAKQLGYDLWCDAAVQCLHQDRNNLICYGLMEGMDQATPMGQLTTKGLKIADIRGNNEPSLTLSQQTEKGGVFHRFDTREDRNPDFRTDGYSLAAKSGTYDIVTVEALLEYFPKDDHLKLMREWIRVGVKGGEFRIKVPNWKEMLDYEHIWQFKYGYNDKTLRKLASATKMLKDIKVDISEEKTDITLVAKIKNNVKWESLQENLNEK